MPKPRSSHPTSSYIGRFAPSPSGMLHMGSLVCALASYLDARANNGKWLVRIEDIDPPREQKGASDAILKTLKAHHLHWDDDVIFQSHRHERYLEHLNNLKQLGLAYPCSCTRARLKNIHVRYDQHCLHQPPKTNAPCALRLNVAACLNANGITFDDAIQGRHNQPITTEHDFVIHRKDQLFAYLLAVNTDDIDQNITHIVRGCDLLDTTFEYIIMHHSLLSRALDRPIKQPQFCHIPVVLDKNGRKMSKQNHANPISNDSVNQNMITALRFLKIDTQGFADLPVQNMLMRAQSQWLAAKTDLAGMKEQSL